MKKVDWILLISIIVISLFGVLMIYSASYVWAEYKFDDPYKFVKTQGLFLIVGYVLIFLMLRIPYTKYLSKTNLIFLVCLILLILVLIPGIGTVRNGSRSWFGNITLGKSSYLSIHTFADIVGSWCCFGCCCIGWAEKIGV